MSKSFFDMVLFLTKYDTVIVYTYGYDKQVGFGIRRVEWRRNDDSRCGIKKTMGFAGGYGVFARQGMDVFHESVCDCIYMCVGRLSGQPDDRSIFRVGWSSYACQRIGVCAVYRPDWIDRICPICNEEG